MRAIGSNSIILTRAVALLLVVCLAECAAEQRINTRGRNEPTIVGKGNGWRAQRGGSCLSYGHSCWGAHGKRSGKAQDPEEEAARSSAHLSDWYLAKLLRKMTGGVNLYPTRKLVPIENISNNELSAILRTRNDNADVAKLFDTEEAGGVDVLAVRRDDDEDTQVKAKLLQIMKDASDDK